jgi:hypothetical protein
MTGVPAMRRDRARLAASAVTVPGDDADRHAARRREHWAIARLTLGLAQMCGTLLSLTLLIQVGVDRWSLSAVVVTCAVTSLSVLLFGSRKEKQ